MTGDERSSSTTAPTRRTVLATVGTGVAALGASTAARQVAADGTDQGRTGIPPTLPSAVDVDAENGTVTLPLFRGSSPAGEVRYVLTESSRLSDALGLGLNWSPKLANALGTQSVQEAKAPDGGRLDLTSRGARFAGTVDFAPERTVAPGPEGFPLDAERSRPGAVGDGAYSPLVTPPERDVVFNAPHVRNETGTHDAVVEIDEEARTATVNLVGGFYENFEVLYVSTDAYPADVAALEGATHVPRLSTLPSPGDRSLEGSAREPIFPVVNGPMGADDPDRQGLRSAVAGEGDPLNVTRSEQVCADPTDPTDCSVHYSPLWDVHPVAWTEDAVDQGLRRRLTDHEEIVALAVEGQLASAADGPINTAVANLRAAVAAVNCPLVAVRAPF